MSAFFKDERTWHWTRWKTHLLRTTLRNVRQPVIPTWASWLLSLQICSLRTCEWSSSLFVKVRWFSISLQDSLHLTNYFSWQSWGWAMEIFIIKRFLLLESLIHGWLVCILLCFKFCSARYLSKIQNSTLNQSKLIP